MLFNSYTFILFLALVLTLHNLPLLSWRAKKVNLLMASYLFYAAWNPPFVILVWLSTIVDYIVGKKIYYEEHAIKRKILLIISLSVNLGLLGFFKYGSFLMDNFVALISLVGVEFQPPQSNIILPVGISFYTFQTLSYTLDMYRRKIEPEKSLLNFSLFVTFFPQLVAGPIVRPSQLLPQFQKPHTATASQMSKGLLLLSLGLFMKVFLADSMLSGPSDSVFGAQQPLLALDAWLGVLAFSGQIFFDFAGYSTCAIGVAACLGFTLPDNFLYPYAAIGFSDFWRRWHITLSSWLRDYLYISLGGNRIGQTRTFVNLMITMLLGGLWHGASWTFVVWGGLHGTYLCLEKLFRERIFRKPLTTLQVVPGQVISQTSFAPAFFRGEKFNNFLLALLTFFLINITWVFFRSPDFTTAWSLLLAMFGQMPAGTAILPTLDIIKVVVVISGMLAVHWLMRDRVLMEVIYKLPWFLLAVIWAGMIILIITSQESSNSFIYFQF